MPISQFELQQMQARLAINRNQKAASACESTAMGVDKESDLHSDILADCRQRGWIALHGSMAQATGRTEGEPDFIILASRGRVFFIECKTRVGKLSPAQHAMAHFAEKLGHKIHLVRNMAQYLEIVK